MSEYTMDELEHKARARQASLAIPLCVSLIYKHREIEETLWEMIAALASKLRPTTEQSITIVGQWTRYVLVKHGDKLRTIHAYGNKAALHAAVYDETVVCGCVLACLVGDPGLNGASHVHLVIGTRYVGHVKMSTAWRRLHDAGV